MPSFDIVSRTEMTEVDNAVQGAMREIGTRYDFKGSSSTIERNDETLLIKTEDDLKLKQVQELLRGHMAKRKVDVGVLDFKEPEKAFGNSLRQTVLVKQGIERDLAQKIAAGLSIELGDDHWTVIEWVRADYFETGASPNVRRTAKGSGVGIDSEAATDPVPNTDSVAVSRGN